MRCELIINWLRLLGTVGHVKFQAGVGRMTSADGPGSVDDNSTRTDTLRNVTISVGE